MITWHPRQGPNPRTRGHSVGRTWASICSTSKGAQAIPSDDRDLVGEAPRDMTHAARIGSRGAGRGDPGELIEWDHGYAYLLLVPGGGESDVAVEVKADRLKAGSINFLVERKFPHKVDPSTATSTCVNGVLSVRVSKAI